MAVVQNKTDVAVINHCPKTMQFKCGYQNKSLWPAFVESHLNYHKNQTSRPIIGCLLSVKFTKMQCLVKSCKNYPDSLLRWLTELNFEREKADTQSNAICMVTFFLKPITFIQRCSKGFMNMPLSETNICKS